MTNKSTAKIAFGVFSLILLFSFGTYAQKTDCSKTTDTDLVAAVNAKLKAKYASQMSHVNVGVVGGEVTLGGWVSNKNIKKDMEKIAKKTACVKKVVNKLRLGIGVGCAPAMKACNGTCIPITEDCPAKTRDE